MQSCLKLVWVLGQHFAHKIHSFTIPYIILFWQQNKTLLSILLANPALLESYLQDEDSQMDTQLKLEEPLVNS